MAHIKIVSFTVHGAEAGAQIAGMLQGQLLEQYKRGEDASLASSSISRFAQQAMVDCDLIIFVGESDAARRTVEPYIADNGYDPGVICVDEQATGVVTLVKSRNADVNAVAEQIAQALSVPLTYERIESNDVI